VTKNGQIFTKFLVVCDVSLTLAKERQKIDTNTDNYLLIRVTKSKAAKLSTCFIMSFLNLFPMLLIFGTSVLWLSLGNFFFSLWQSFKIILFQITNKINLTGPNLINLTSSSLTLPGAIKGHLLEH